MIGWLSCNYKRGIAYGWISVMVGCNSRLRLRLGLGLGLGPYQKKACVIESYLVTFYTSDIITLYF